MKKALLGIACLSLLALPRAAVAASRQYPDTPAGLIARMTGSLQDGDWPGYLRSFIEEIRPAEQSWMEGFLKSLKIDKAGLETAGVKDEAEGRAAAFVRASFENPYMAVIESWLLRLERRTSGWAVAGKEVIGGGNTLYKIRIPAERSERVRRVDIRHQDILLTFSDAVVFYDNVPNVETALVVLGKGSVRFSPSDANERHQLDLVYKKRVIEDAINSVYVRCSQSLFASNITIDRGGRTDPVLPAERDLAAAVFARNYARSFTIESSWSKDLLSFLPQGEEAVFEFKAKKSGELTYIYSPFAEEEVNLYDRGRDRIVNLYSPRDESEPPAKRFFITFAEKFDIADYALDLSYSPAGSFLSAKARISVLPKVDLLDSLKFRFNPELEILKIADEEGRELFYTQDRGRKLLYVYFLTPRREKGPTAIEVFYRGKVIPAPPASDVLPQGGMSERLRFRPRYETFFFSHAGYWYPAPAEEDFFRARLTVVIPPEYKCVAIGQMTAKGRWDEMDDLGSIEKAGSDVYTFESRSPVKYLAFLVGKFSRQLDGRGPVPLETYVSTEIMDSRPGLAGQAAEIIEFFQAAFGPFPFEKLGIVLRLWPTSGGHSPASFVVLNEVPWIGDTGFAPPADTPVDLSDWDEYFLAHEIAHQWWGQGVSFATYKDQWLSEGLAQYAAASFLRAKYGEKAFAAILKKLSRWTKKKSYRGPVVMGSRLSHYDYEAYQAVVYNKAALALFMLRDLLGGDVFDRGLRAFFEANKFTGARTGQFIAAMEEASGRDLKAFFQGWLSSYDLPDVQTTWTVTRVPDGFRLDLHVAQVVGRFVFPLRIAWTCGGQDRRTLVVVDETNETFSWTLADRPEKIRVNPDLSVPGRFY